MNQLLETATAGPSSFGRRSRLGSLEVAAPPHGPGGQTERTRVEQSIRYMIEHLTERLNVPTLAALAHASPSGYFALFKRQSGFAPIDLLIHLRMYRACVLLEATELTVKEIATALGYEDAFYFSRLFKAVNHVAPSDYRLLPGANREALREAGLPEICWPLRASLEAAAPCRFGSMRASRPPLLFK